MAFPNPALDPPRLASTASHSSRLSLHSRSPSRSPTRQHDPFLRSLSPTKTLRAFASRSNGRSPNDDLARSIEEATHSQRAHGTKIAQACADLREWTREIEGWEWPGTFSLAETKQSYNNKHAEEEGESWGSLPAFTVQKYESRVEEICQHFDNIDFEQLKSFVLSAHSRAGVSEASLDDSIGTIGAATDLKRLDDFTALVTATILQALPFLPKLTHLLDTWTIRLALLRSAPKYLDDLKQARTQLDRGWAALGAPTPSTTSRDAQILHHTPSLSRDKLEAMKELISSRIYTLGKRLDRFLDMLEGRREVVPDAWIDDFEVLEAEYADWVVKAERIVLEGEWKSTKFAIGKTPRLHADEEEMGAGVRGVGVNGNGDVAAAHVGMSNGADREIAFAGVDESTTTANGLTSTNRSTTATSINIQPTIITEPARTSTSSSRKENSSPTRSRHVPIVIDYSHPDEPFNITSNATPHPTASTSTPTANDSPLPSSEGVVPQQLTLTRTKSKTPSENSLAQAGGNVKQRAAFLNGDIEKSESLLKSKSAPIVRPFEHASNAFTRLFKREGGGFAGERGVGNDHGAAEGSVRGSGKHDRLEYMDLVGAPSSGFSVEKARDLARGREKERGRMEGQGKRLVYGDLVMPIPSQTKEQEKASSDRSIGEMPRPSPAVVATEAMNVQPRTYQPTHSTARNMPVTYRPTGLQTYPPDSSPKAAQDDFPPNWPLSASATPTSDDHDEDDTLLTVKRDTLSTARSRSQDALERSVQTSSSRKPSVGKSEDGEEFFVRSFPRREGGSAAAKTKVARRDFGWDGEEGNGQEELVRPSSAPGFRTGENRFVPTSSTRSVLKSARGGPPNIGASSSAVRPVSAVVEEEEESFDGDEYTLGEDVVGADRDSGNQAQLLIRARSTPLVIPEVIPESTSNANVNAVGGEGSKEVEDVTIKRASVTSIERHSLDEVKSIEVPRRSLEERPRRSLEERSTIEPPKTPKTPKVESKARAAIPPGPRSPSTSKSVKMFPTPPPNVPMRGSSLGVKNGLPPVKTDTVSLVKPRLASPVPEEDRASVSPPWNYSVTKQRPATKPPSRGNVSAGGASPEKNKRSSLGGGGGGDHIDRHVSEVLTRVHAPIRFKTRPGSVTPVSSSRAQTPNTATATSQQKLRARAERQGKNMTLAPAEASSHSHHHESSSSTTDGPEVKLYHLTQVGRAEPIKLFVRLVGEGEKERVMVRVGGGWADLADYLRLYAEHHGSRTVSDGGVEVKTADSPGSVAGVTSSGADSSRKRAVSGSALASKEKEKEKEKEMASPVTTPTFNKVASVPVAAERAESSTAAATTSTPTTSWAIGRGKPRLWLGGDDDDEDDNVDYEENEEDNYSEQSQSPTFARALPWEDMEAPANSVSRPSTASGNSTLRPSSRQAVSSSPVSPILQHGKVRTGLPEQKAKWVEGMIEKAMRSASAGNSGTSTNAQVEKDKEKERGWGEIGRVGGTRRVVLKGVEGGK